MAPFMMYHTHSFAAHSLAGPVLMIGLWVIQLLHSFLIPRDAKKQKMFAQVWTVLAILPLFGYFIDVLYLIIREVRP